MTQDAATLALRPKLGWAVRQGSDLDRLFALLSKHAPSPPLEGPDFDHCIEGFGGGMRCELPGDFLAFYKHCNGVGLFGDAYRFRPLEDVELVENVLVEEPEGSADYHADSIRMAVGPWVRFCDLADGSFLVIEMRHTYKKGWKVVRVGPTRDGVSPVVAWSFQGFLDRALDGSFEDTTVRAPGGD